MKAHGRHWCAAAAFVLLAAAAPTTTALGGTGNPQQIPFHAALDFASAPAATNAPCASGELRIDVVASSGVATHLGSFGSRDYYACLNPLTLAFHGRYVFVAANGDTIEGGYAGRFVVTSDPAELGVDAHWFIDGGSGRFAGATGGGAATGSGTLVGGHIDLDGSMSSVGSLQ